MNANAKINGAILDFALRNQDLTTIKVNKLCRKYKVELVQQGDVFVWAYPITSFPDQREVWLTDRLPYRSLEEAQLSALSHIADCSKLVKELH